MTETDRAALRRLYDDVLRAHEMTAPSALEVSRVGPVAVARYAGGRGFVTYRDLAGLDEGGVRRLVGEVVGGLQADPAITRLEWKTRGHDHAPSLAEALIAHGLVPEEPESVMIGPAAALVGHPTPDGVVVRQIVSEAEVRDAEALASAVFGSSAADEQRIADELVATMAARPDEIEMWVAEVDGEVVCSGRLEHVPGTPFAGLWGGATRADRRRQGIYRALTAARARSAVAHGVRYLHSDSSAHSRPVLERSGLTAVTTTTPFVWRREPPMGRAT